MNNAEIKAQAYVRLKALGYKVQMNYRVPLHSGVVGYKVLVVDLVVRDINDNIKALFYIGRIKPRKDSKYKMLKTKIFYIKDEDSINKALEAFKAYSIRFLFS